MTCVTRCMMMVCDDMFISQRAMTVMMVRDDAA